MITDALSTYAPQSSSVSPFLRSLSTALSLRYPLHSSGDPFARPAHALALSGVVNCLPLVTSASATGTEPYPLEATENDLVKKQIGERVATMVGAVRGLLPILRTAAGRPGAPTGVLLSLRKLAASASRLDANLMLTRGSHGVTQQSPLPARTCLYPSPPSPRPQTPRSLPSYTPSAARSLPRFRRTFASRPSRLASSRRRPARRR